MASLQIPEVVDRDYTDNFSVKEMARNILVPKYFEGIDLSNLNVGLTGYVTELISDGMEDTFNSVSTLHEEMFPNRSKLPSSIMSHAAIFQLSNGMCTAAKCDFILIMKEDYVIKNFQTDMSGNNVFYIDKDTKILVEDIVYTLDYDILIRGIWREVANGYIYSAQYVITNETNSISSVTTPYIAINKSSNGYLSLKVTCHQCQRVVEYENIINNTKINLPTFDITFDGQLAGFDIFYKGSTDTDYGTQLEKLPKFSTPLKTPFCFYSFSDENTLQILFSNRDTYFQPDFNSECKIVLYISDGAKGNFDIYSGKNTSVVTTSDRYPYNDNFFLVAQVMSASVEGKDTRSLEELQALTVEGYRTANIYATDNDLMEYFNNYPYRYNNECLFIKKRDDVIDRLYSGFLIMKKDDYIYPTNTMNFDGNLDQFTNTAINKYILDPGCLFTYTDDGHCQICYNEDELNTLKEEYNQYLIDNEDVDPEAYSFWNYVNDQGKTDTLRYTIFDTDKLEELKEANKFLYVNPFLIAVSKSPTLVGMYNTIVNDNVQLDFIDQNLSVFDQFIATTLYMDRELSEERKYTLSLSLMPAATLSTEEELITTYGDIENTKNNLLRVVVTFEDTDGTNLCYAEMVPVETTTNGTYRFEANIYTDDHVTTTNKFRITDGVTKMVEIDDLIVPMTTVVNVYILYKGEGIPTNNIFYQYDTGFQDYSWSNIYSTDNYPLTFIKPMNMVKLDLAFKDYRLDGIAVNDCTISSIPLIGIEAVEDEELFDYFISTFNDQYSYLEKSVEYLKTATNIDLKFYNTYGRSNNFIIGDEVDGEELIDTINITIRYYVWVLPNTDQVKAETDLKQYIKDYIEKVNTDGTNSFYNSNLVRSIENDFNYVHHVKFIGINDYEPKYQSVKNITVNLDELTKEERLNYVPEILVANLDHIELTFFES